MTTDNRTNEPKQNETKLGKAFCFTDEQVEAAAKALYESQDDTWQWDEQTEEWKIATGIRGDARAALVAAAGASSSLLSCRSAHHDNQCCGYRAEDAAENKPGQSGASLLLSESRVDESEREPERGSGNEFGHTSTLCGAAPQAASVGITEVLELIESLNGAISYEHYSALHDAVSSLAEVERAAAEKALTEFAEQWATADGIEALMFATDDVSAVQITEKLLLARAAAYRREETE